MKCKNEWIQVLKMLACLLITNSHCMYPATLLKIGGASSVFQAGGGWGVTLFFAVSGYLSAGSGAPFGAWLRKRYLRILPVSVIMVIVYYFVSSSQMPFPHFLCVAYWFVTAIVIYYPVFYLLDHIKHGYLAGIAAYCILYAILYICIYDGGFFVEKEGTSFFKSFQYFIVMLMGGLYKKQKARLKLRSIPVELGLILLGIGIWALEYALMTFFKTGYALQFLITVSRCAVVIPILSLVDDLQEKKPLTLKKNGFIDRIADSTLEIYLVQIAFLPLINKLEVPYSILVFWVTAIVGGCLVHQVYTGLIDNIFQSTGDKAAK